MEADSMDTAAVDLLLSKSPVPATLVHFRTQLEQAKTRLGAFQESWEQHLRDVTSHASKLQEQHPVTLTANTWASPAAVSSALTRLKAYQQLICKRIQPLSTIFQLSTPASVHDLMCTAMNRRPIGPETRVWCFITAICEGELGMREATALMTELEKRMVQLLQALLDVHGKLVTQINSPGFAIACLAATTIETLRDLLEESAGMEGMEREDIDRAYEECMDVMNRVIRRAEGRINILHWHMSKLGMKTARQAVMFEYCELPYV